MINHSNCAHPRTSSARAKCRRGGNGQSTPKVIDLRNGTPTGKPRTPRDRDKACDVCGVEKRDRKGTDPITDILIFVGPKCAYMIKDALDITPIDD